MGKAARLRVVILKPSKYAIDGYVERFRWGFVLSAEPVWWTAIGAIPLVTGLIGWCPVYLPLGFSSKK